MTRWLLIAAFGLVLLSGCTAFRNWLANHNTANLIEELRTLEQLLNESQGGRKLDVPINLGDELAKIGLRGNLPKATPK